MMDAPLIDQRVSCRKCQFCFAVQLSPIQGRWIESQCPACEVWACFTIADSPERQPSLPDSEELEERDRTIQRLGEQLWPPIKAYSNHPSVAWFDRIGNGVFADDHSRICWPASCWVYRFSRGGMAAYIWQEEESLFVRGWHPIGSRRSPPEPAEVFSFLAALNRLCV